MKLLTYIWRNVTRNKLRSSLTILSVGFSLALMTILYGYLAMQKVARAEADKHDRLAVLNKLGFAGAVADRPRRSHSTRWMAWLRRHHFRWFGGNYKGQQFPFAQFGVEPKYAFDVFDEYEIHADQLAAFKNDRQGCVADQNACRTDGLGNWRANSAGGNHLSLRPRPATGRYFRGPRQYRLAAGSTGTIWTKNSKRRAEFRGNAGMIYAKCKVSDEVAIVSEEIDAKFANSENATRTRTEAAFQRLFADMLGDVQTYIRYISLAVVFALALVAATAMAMSMRERTTEVAVLKAIGFSKRRVLALVLGESTTDRHHRRLAGNCRRTWVLCTCSPASRRRDAVSDSGVRPWPVPGSSACVWSPRNRICQRRGARRYVAAQLSVVDGLRRVV